MSMDLKRACTRVFASLDVEGQGYLTRDQMVLALRMLNFNPIDSEIAEQPQYNNNRRFSYEEFLSFIKSMKLPTLDEQRLDLRAAFAKFDRMNTGMILKDEFVEILTQCGEMKIDEKEAMVWADVLDLHKDGKLRIAELEELFVNDEDIESIINGQSWDRV